MLRARDNTNVSTKLFFCGEFLPHRDKKKRPHESNKGVFGNLKKNRHILRKKKIRSHQI
jgi:hypothetical protein